MSSKRIATTLTRTSPSQDLRQSCSLGSPSRFQCLFAPNTRSLTTTNATPQHAGAVGPGFRPNTLSRPQLPSIKGKRREFNTNDDPEVLNAMYIKLLGPGGDKGLSEDIKWQCMTHKTFDHGMQAYNEKLGFYGRRIAYLHATLNFLRKSTSPFDTALAKPSLHRSDSLQIGLNSISYLSVKDLLSSDNLFAIAEACGIVRCLRWTPVDEKNLVRSGVDGVAVEALMAVIGAVSMQRGGDAARRVMEERILVGLSVVKTRR